MNKGQILITLMIYLGKLWTKIVRSFLTRVSVETSHNHHDQTLKTKTKVKSMGQLYERVLADSFGGEILSHVHSCWWTPSVKKIKFVLSA